jgi:hypothetical protein
MSSLGGARQLPFERTRPRRACAREDDQHQRLAAAARIAAGVGVNGDADADAAA